MLGWMCMWACGAGRAAGGEVFVRVENPPTNGMVVAWLFDSADAFADLRDPLATRMQPAGEESEIRFERLAPGRYAVLVYHDRNANGALDQNYLGIPKEPLGFSQRYWARGAPAFSAAAMEVAEGERVPVDIQLREVFPRKGLIGVGAGVLMKSSPYRGSDSVRVQGIPAITYIGQRFQILGPFAQVGLVSWPRIRLAATARYRLGAYDESDSDELDGMGDRKDSLFGGLALQSPLAWGLRVSAGYEHDLLDRVGGGSGRLAIRRGFQLGRFSVSPSLGINWLTSELARHEYGVRESEALDERPAYRPGPAVNVEPGLGVSAEFFGGWRFMVNGSVEILAKELRDSPLVDESVVYRLFASVSRMF